MENIERVSNLEKSAIRFEVEGSSIVKLVLEVHDVELDVDVPADVVSLVRSLRAHESDVARFEGEGGTPS